MGKSSWEVRSTDSAGQGLFASKYSIFIWSTFSFREMKSWLCIRREPGGRRENPSWVSNRQSSLLPGKPRYPMVDTQTQHNCNNNGQTSINIQWLRLSHTFPFSSFTPKLRNQTQFERLQPQKPKRALYWQGVKGPSPGGSCSRTPFQCQTKVLSAARLQEKER